MKVTENVHALDPTKGNYAYVILGEEIVLIDAGYPWQGEGILNDLKSIGIKPQDIKHILITHYDLDHIGSLALLEKETGASIWASKEDIPYIAGKKGPEGIRRLYSIFRVKKPEKVNPYPKEQKLGDIEVIPTPGHTPGHVCLLYENILFAGDLVMTSKGQIRQHPTLWRSLSFLNWLFRINTSIFIGSIKKVDALSFKWLCPAHGEPIKRNNRKLI